MLFAVIFSWIVGCQRWWVKGRHTRLFLSFEVEAMVRVYLALFPGPSFSFKSDGEKQGLVHTVCACAELRAIRGEKGVGAIIAICRFSSEERVEHSIAIFSS